MSMSMLMLMLLKIFVASYDVVHLLLITWLIEGTPSAIEITPALKCRRGRIVLIRICSCRERVEQGMRIIFRYFRSKNIETYIAM